ncbi:hypothetical protein GCM10009133_17240 [Cocleimonas flava]|jgi:hypothetical protein|uniref:Antibiotic biosynthesis monooxygenase n=1 Tax=Cocleimonas flava TaxID=634765 RepID=A0A4R1EVC8_9GAMM|nr:MULTISPECIES: antibiotic biosynthesis monooxygenase [Cocleimonas]MEB8434023.1 antibiotic biosynthesis monooxygenase [Cocleimonas sp. KMM 6892]MEC4716834.1 antibiotic biosynthesis monooxygenase [Cocleimonas sp. KMM 6895]MEC4746011.1 antibiotic biosynthesis monooxygenase [Cocleimonas sp. KMM 6896]TCJ84650.1 antibiotic biosynthesis monooxygenase [Cocleimonas flava]
MFKDIITYELDDDVDEAYLLNIAGEIIESWMSKQPGFIQWDIHKNTIGDGYTDIVYWETREAAQAAEQQMGNIPNAADWFSCYKEGSIGSQNLQQLGSFK